MGHGALLAIGGGLALAPVLGLAAEAVLTLGGYLGARGAAAAGAGAR